MPARLIPLSGGPAIVMDKPIILVGRQPDCDAVLQSSTKVSRKHCCLAQVNNRYVIRDLGSMNGIRINGVRVNEQELKPGDEVGIGDVYFVFRDEAAKAVPVPQSPVAAQRANATIPLEDEEALARGAAEMSMEFPVAMPEDLADDVVPVGSDPGPLIHADEDDIQLKD